MFWQFFHDLQNCFLEFLNETVSFWTCVPCTLVIKDCTFIRDIRVQSALAAVWLNFDQGCVFSVCSRPHTTMKNAEKLKSVSRLFLVQYPLGISPQESDWWLGDTNLIVNNLFPLGHSNLDHATSSKRWRLERFI